MLAVCLRLFLRLLETTHNDPITTDTIVTISARVPVPGLGIYQTFRSLYDTATSIKTHAFYFY